MLTKPSFFNIHKNFSKFQSPKFCYNKFMHILTLLHSERPNLAFLSARGLNLCNMQFSYQSTMWRELITWNSYLQSMKKSIENLCLKDWKFEKWSKMKFWYSGNFTHIFNMPVAWMLGFKLFHQKLWEELITKACCLILETMKIHVPEFKSL